MIFPHSSWIVPVARWIITSPANSNYIPRSKPIVRECLSITRGLTFPRSSSSLFPRSVRVPSNRPLSVFDVERRSSADPAINDISQLNLNGNYSDRIISRLLNTSFYILAHRGSVRVERRIDRCRAALREASLCVCPWSKNPRDITMSRLDATKNSPRNGETRGHRSSRLILRSILSRFSTAPRRADSIHSAESLVNAIAFVWCYFSAVRVALRSASVPLWTFIRVTQFLSCLIDISALSRRVFRVFVYINAWLFRRCCDFKSINVGSSNIGVTFRKMWMTPSCSVLYGEHLQLVFRVVPVKQRWRARSFAPSRGYPSLNFLDYWAICEPRYAQVSTCTTYLLAVIHLAL